MSKSKDYLIRLNQFPWQSEGQKQRALKIAKEIEEVERRKDEDNKKLLTGSEKFWISVAVVFYFVMGCYFLIKLSN